MKVTKKYGKITVDISFPDDPEDSKKLQDIFSNFASDKLTTQKYPQGKQDLPGTSSVEKNFI